MKLTIERAFLNHLAHLAVRHVDAEGVECRVLRLDSCEPCRALWATLTPRPGRGFPAPVADGLSGAYVRADVIDPPAPARGPAERGEPAESAAVQRLNEFTSARARRARLEHY